MELRRHDPLADGMPIHVPPGLIKCNIPVKDWGSSLVVYEICNQTDPGSRSFNFLESQFFHSHEVIQFGVCILNNCCMRVCMQSSWHSA